ncbi:MAG: hypothetical protein GSR86_05935 [Desulfurococcales archaeon]|nr:hypothetical protein [Desulfurococcales archaeon]
MPVRTLHIRVYIHATEDEDKVIRAVRNIIPADILEEADKSIETYQGHYGNPIKVLRITISGGRVKDALESILGRLSPADKASMRSSLDERVDKTGTLHIRLSKQDALQGRLILYEADDVIKVEIGFTGGRRKAIKSYEEMLGGG